MQIVVAGNQYVIRCDARDLNVVRSLPVRRYDGKLDAWVAPFIKETYDALRALNAPIGGLAVPTESGYKILKHKEALLLLTPGSPEDQGKAQRIPDYRGWNAKLGGWVVKASKANITYLLNAFPRAAWQSDPNALALVFDLIGQQDAAVRLSETKQTLKQLSEADLKVEDYKFKTKPFAHQTRAFLLSRDAEAYALFMEQGTGKSKVLIDTFAWLYLQNKINAVLIICPNSMKDVWADQELPAHLPDYVTADVFVWRGHEKKTAEWLNGPGTGAKLRIFIINVDALSHDKGTKAAKLFLAKHDALAAVDESSKIKTPSSKRTRNVVKLRDFSKYRRVLTGTPVTQGPLDVFAQFKYLDEKILGFSSFTAFKNKYALIGGFNGKQVVGYQHIDELQRTIEPYSFRVLRADCLDLPPKLYEKRVVELTPQQRAIYKQMKDEMMVEFDGKIITSTMAAVQMMRLQQITGGFLPMMEKDDVELEADVLAAALQDAYENQPEVQYRKSRDYADITPIPGGNPKVDALLDIAEETQGKVIVWARFRAEIELIANTLREHYGDESVVEFHGGVTALGRATARKRFQDPQDKCRFFIGQTETGGIGLTLTEAKTVVYYSNSFNLESRLQSEDRAHRIGQTKSVLYIDLIAKNTLDTKVVNTLRNKQNVANLVTGDSIREWI